MQMWQDLEEAAARSHQQQQHQQQHHPHGGRRANHARSRRHHAGGGGSGGLPQFAPPHFLLGGAHGMPPALLFGGAAGGVGGPAGPGGPRHGGGAPHAPGPFGLPASLVALREAVVGMQRTGLPPQLLFSDRDFTADDYEMLCRLDETVENKKGASAAQLAALPAQTVPAGGLLGEGGERLRCSVCLEEFDEGQALCSLPCVHKFHAGCIRTWLQQKATCPVCQQKL
jgi:hypothetical protein